MDESGDFWRSVTTEMAVSHNKCEPAPPAAFQSVLAVAAAVMQRRTPQKKKSLTGKSGKAQPVPPTGIEPVRCFHRGILSPLRLPVPPRRLTVWYCSAKRGNCQSAKPCRPECKKANGLFAANGKAAHFMWQCTRYFICDVFFVSAHITHLSYRAVRRRRHGESCNAAGNAGTSEKRCSRSEGMPRR